MQIVYTLWCTHVQSEFST